MFGRLAIGGVIENEMAKLTIGDPIQPIHYVLFL